jgi:hypothetical protein
MGSLTGDDRDWLMSGYGVLGIGTPRTMPTEDGGTADVDAYGVWGLLGTNDDIAGIVDEVTNNDSIGSPRRSAVRGRSLLVDQGSAVYGELGALDSEVTAFGFIGGRSPYAGEVTGVFGQGTERGVIGIAAAADPYAIGVYGGSVGGAGIGVCGDSEGTAGVLGRTSGGVGVYGQVVGSGIAGKFDGDVEVTGRLVHNGTISLNGDIEVSGDLRLLNQDLAEEFEIADTEAEEGSVMVLADGGALTCSREAYDRKVAGIVAGAGSFRPAIVLGRVRSSRQRVPIALTGKTYCRVDASRAPIEPGDLLTSSDLPGHAMKATDPARAFGAVVGKALGTLASGCGLLPVLVSLQ